MDQVKSVLDLKKPAVRFIFAAAAVCVLIAVFFLTSMEKPTNRRLKEEAFALASGCAMVNEVAIDKKDAEIIRHEETGNAEVVFPVKYADSQITVQFTVNDGEIYSASVELEK